MADASVTRKLVRELPALGEEMRRWQKAVARLDRMNSGPNRLAAASASAQLARSLNPFGIKLPIFAAETGPSSFTSGLPKPNTPVRQFDSEFPSHNGGRHIGPLHSRLATTYALDRALREAALHWRMSRRLRGRDLFASQNS